VPLLLTTLRCLRFTNNKANRGGYDALSTEVQGTWDWLEQLKPQEIRDN